MSFSHTVAVIAIWSLLLAGCFFAGRAHRRRRAAARRARPEGRQPEPPDIPGAQNP